MADSARRVCAISATTTSDRRPSARTRSVVMPWTSLAAAGISIPGSASQSQRCSSSPSASRTATHADTMRAVSTSMPVVSRSKTPRRSAQLLMGQGRGRDRPRRARRPVVHNLELSRRIADGTDVQPVEALRAEGQRQLAVVADRGELAAAEQVVERRCRRPRRGRSAPRPDCARTRTRTGSAPGRRRTACPIRHIRARRPARTRGWSAARGCVPSPNVGCALRTWITLRTQCSSERDCASCDSTLTSV